MWRLLRDWWRGKRVEGVLDLRGKFPIAGVASYKRPGLALAWEGLKSFCARHWKWLITTVIAVIAALATVLPLFKR
jgi:hypothetical protein